MGTASSYASRFIRGVAGPDVYNGFRKLYRHARGLHINLQQSSGVIHVGANAGQERELYDSFDLDVIWIEPIPDVFRRLQSNISSFPKQRAYQNLVTDIEGKEYIFHVSNNEGESSSVFDLSRHREMWPDVHYSRDIPLKSTTLCALLRKENVDLSRFQTLVLDTQGAELLVLKGCTDILSSFRFLQMEAYDIELYAGCCVADELTAFVREYGFHEHRREVIRATAGVGTCWNILYQRQS